MKPSPNVTRALSQCVAETYTLYLNTQKCHWNVEGPHFHSLHLLFEKQYESLVEDVDTLAERIRGLEAYAPGSFKEFEKLSGVKQLEESKIAWDKMITFLLAQYEILLKTLYDSFKIAQTHEDEGTADIILTQIETREKAVWMLRSLVKE